MEEEKKYIRCRVILEMLGKPKEHIENTLKSYVQKIKEDSSLMVVKEDFADSQEQDSMWSTFVELEIVFKDIKKLLPFCFDYMPSSVEIIKPKDILILNHELSDFLNDLQAKLHNVDMIAKQLRAANTVLKKNLNTSLKNVILLSFSVKKNLSLDEISKFSGIKKEELNPFLEQLIKEGRLIKEGNGYILK